MAVASSSVYIRKYFKEEAKSGAKDIAKYILSTFVRLLEQNEWMDDKTREAALSKAETMGSYVAHPKELLDDEILDEYYSKLNIEPNNLFANILRLNKFHSDKHLAQFRTPVDKNDWKIFSDMTSVNAFYAPHSNSFGTKTETDSETQLSY